MAATLTSERAVLDALAVKFSAPAHVLLPGVPDGTGQFKRRTIDAIIASVWPSRGLWIAGVEIKVSRSDLLRELANPKKQESIYKHCDYFWLAVGDESIVRDGEVPETWGLLVPGRGGRSMKVAKDAPKLEPEPIGRKFLTSVLRRASDHVASQNATLAAEIRKEVEASVADELKRLRARELEFIRVKHFLDQAALIDRFLQRANIRLAGWNKDAIDQAADIVRVIGSQGHAKLFARARREAEAAMRVAETMAEDAERLLDAIKQFEVEHASEGDDDLQPGRPAVDSDPVGDSPLLGGEQQPKPDHAQG